MRLRALFFVLTLLAGALPSAAQVGNTVSSAAAAGGISPEIVEILGISVEGASDDYANSFIQQTSRLQVGQRLTLPGDPALGDAIRSIYRLRTYEDIQIVQERRVGQGVYLVIRVREVPKLRDYEFLNECVKIDAKAVEKRLKDMTVEDRRLMNAFRQTKQVESMHVYQNKKDPRIEHDEVELIG